MPRRPVAVLILVLLVALSGGTSASAEPKLERDLADRAVQQGNAHYIVGRATPDGAGKTVIFKVRLCAEGCAWKRYAKVRTDEDGRFRVRVDFPDSAEPTWSYKGYLPGGTTYRTARTDVYLACSRADC